MIITYTKYGEMAEQLASVGCSARQIIYALREYEPVSQKEYDDYNNQLIDGYDVYQTEIDGMEMADQIAEGIDNSQEAFDKQVFDFYNN